MAQRFMDQIVTALIWQQVCVAFPRSNLVIIRTFDFSAAQGYRKLSRLVSSLLRREHLEER
jgi:hypothetical protein